MTLKSLGGRGLSDQSVLLCSSPIGQTPPVMFPESPPSFGCSARRGKLGQHAHSPQSETENWLTSDVPTAVWRTVPLTRRQDWPYVGFICWTQNVIVKLEGVRKKEKQNPLCSFVTILAWFLINWLCAHLTELSEGRRPCWHHYRSSGVSAWGVHFFWANVALQHISCNKPPLVCLNSCAAPECCQHQCGDRCWRPILNINHSKHFELYSDMQYFCSLRPAT